MYRTIKTLHLLGLAAFLGSVLSHITAGVLGGGPESSRFLFARELISGATSALTMPGLALAAITGIAMMVLSRQTPVRHPWLAIHGGLGAVVGVLAAAVILPAGGRVLDAAAHGAAAPSALLTEHVAGTINIALTVAIVALGVFKPKWFARAQAK